MITKYPDINVCVEKISKYLNDEYSINLNDEDNWKKRGIAIYKQDKEIVGYNKKENKNQVSYRSFSFADLEIPIFSENFFKDINII